MMFTAEELRTYVIRDVLRHLEDWSPAAENLLLGTAAQESGLGICMKDGRRIGLFHITTAMHLAVWDKYLVSRPNLASIVRGMASQKSFLESPHGELIANLRYATAIAWLVYRRAEQPLPDENDLPALAHFWKRHFHPTSKDSEKNFVRNYLELVKPHVRLAA